MLCYPIVKDWGGYMPGNIVGPVIKIKSGVFVARGQRRPPLVFTEPGVSMLSTVLNSGKAARINVEIVREVVRALHSMGLSAWEMFR